MKLEGCEIELEFVIDKAYIESTKRTNGETCIDDNDHLNWGEYMRILEKSRLAFHEQLFISENKMRHLRTPIIMHKTNHEFPGEVKLGDTLRVVYGIYELPIGARVNMMAKLYVDDKLVHVNPHVACFKNLATGKGTRIPKWYMETLEKYVVD